MQSLTLRWLHIDNFYQFSQLYAFQNPRGNVYSQTTIYQKFFTSFAHYALFSSRLTALRLFALEV